jgi:hypothetical protein
MNGRDPSPLQIAKALGLPYVRIVVDLRHLKEGHGKIEFDGPVTQIQASEAHNLLWEIINTDEDGNLINAKEAK